MKYYQLSSDSQEFRFVTLKKESDWHAVNEVDRYDIFSISNFAYTLSKKIEDGRAKPVGDFPALPDGRPIFSSRTKASFSSCFSGDETIGEIEIEGAPFYFFLPVRLAGALAIEESNLKFFPGGNRIMFIENYCFCYSEIKDFHFFHILEKSVSPLFVSEKIKAKAEENDLQGLIFNAVEVI